MRLHTRLPQDQEGLPDRPIEVNHFRMSVPDGGYCWLDDARPMRLFGEENRQLLGPAPHMAMRGFVSGNKEIPAREYFPLLDTPDLFLRFKDLNLDPESILIFANKYGWIGGTGDVQSRGRDWIRAVGIHSWHSEIQAMIVVDHLWECLRKDDRRTLRKYFTWQSTEFNVLFAIQTIGREVQSDDQGQHGAQTGQPIASWGTWLVQPTDVDLLKTIGWNHSDVCGPARLAIMRIVNPKLEAHCHPQLYLDSRGHFTGRWAPANLLGCIWLQFYMTLIGQLKLRLCTVCKRPMDVSQSRKTKKMHETCSKRVRMRRMRAKLQGRPSAE
jgi:hypothetical protein